MADDNNTNIDTTTSTPDTGGSSGEPSLHDDIASAFEQIETRDAPPAAADAPATSGDATAPSVGGRIRGPDGKFVAAPDAPAKLAEKALAAPPKPEAAPTGKQPVAAPQKPPEAAPAAAAAPQAARAPVSWKPAAREHWAKLPPEVQQEVARREVEAGRRGAREPLLADPGDLRP